MITDRDRREGARPGQGPGGQRAGELAQDRLVAVRADAPAVALEATLVTRDARLAEDVGKLVDVIVTD
jgi:hypothetical protein